MGGTGRERVDTGQAETHRGRAGGGYGEGLGVPRREVQPKAERRMVALVNLIALGILGCRFFMSILLFTTFLQD